MLLDDIIYVGTLIACIAFGVVYRDFREPRTKQWVGTGFGLFVSFVVSGRHVVHPVLSTIVTAVLVTNLPKRLRHTVAFFFSFFYLLVVVRLATWYGGEEPSAHTNLLQMILTLRLAGLGFELNSAADSLEEDPDNETYKAMKRITVLDVFHYGMAYAGLLTGPFYTYKTHWDCVNRNFSDYIDCWGRTLEKLKLTACVAILYLIVNYFYTIDYVFTEEFQGRSLWYRYFYVYPSFLNFKTRIYVGMLLSECVCQMAGVGAYPASSEPRPGLGPKEYKKALELSANPTALKNEGINFETVHNINIMGVETCYEVRKAMKFWNTTVQYWMALYVYKQFPSKALRTTATFIVSSVWHGYAFGYYVTNLSIVYFLPMEDLYVKLYNQSPEESFTKKILWTLLWFLRFTCMSYLGVGFQLLSYENTMYYYNNIYWVGHIAVALLYIAGRLLKPYLIVKSDKQS